MLKRRQPLWSYWFLLGALLAGVGGIPLLSGTAPLSSFRHLAKLTVGAIVIAYSLWMRHRESQAILLGTMSPNEEL